MIYGVELSRKAQRQLSKVPLHILNKIESWIEFVEVEGLEEVRKRPGFHDEKLKGERSGQRSIRLSRSYRAIYSIHKDKVEFVLIEEVNKHEY